MLAKEDSTASVRAAVRHQTSDVPGVYYVTSPSESTYASADIDITVTNARPFADEFTLERNGFELRRRKTAITDYQDEEQLSKIYEPEIKQFVMEATGAKEVVILEVNYRNAGMDRADYQPSRDAHVDFDPKTYKYLTSKVLGEEETEKRFRGPWVAITVWRPEVLVESDPIAVCDASTVEPGDLVEASVAFTPGDEPFPIIGMNLKPSPRHRWYYFPHMNPEEILFLKIQQSDTSKPTSSPHVAIRDPNTAPDAPPRSSIEVRTIAFL